MPSHEIINHKRIIAENARGVDPDQATRQYEKLF
jgi:hypothetical protein